MRTAAGPWQAAESFSAQQHQARHPQPRMIIIELMRSERSPHMSPATHTGPPRGIIYVTVLLSTEFANIDRGLARSLFRRVLDGFSPRATHMCVIPTRHTGLSGKPLTASHFFWSYFHRRYAQVLHEQKAVMHMYRFGTKKRYKVAQTVHSRLR